MTTTTPLVSASAGAEINSRIDAFLAAAHHPTPVLVVDVEAVVARYLDLRRALPDARVYYAVKANPLPEIVRALAAAGCRFDVASAPEIRHCLALGVASRISRSATRSSTRPPSRRRRRDGSTCSRATASASLERLPDTRQAPVSWCGC